jgi:hypothetical protein
MARLLACALVMTGCFGPDQVETRACNDTESDFATFEYGGHGDHGPLRPGGCTVYTVAHTPVYRYTAVRLTIEEGPIELLPIDFVGETPLPGGKWSYRLSNIDYDNLSLDLEAVED